MSEKNQFSVCNNIPAKMLEMRAGCVCQRDERIEVKALALPEADRV